MNSQIDNFGKLRTCVISGSRRGVSLFYFGILRSVEWNFLIDILRQGLLEH
jgi:hypothetical protein